MPSRPVQAAGSEAKNPRRRWLWWFLRLGAAACCPLLVAAVEIRTSWIQSYLFAGLAGRLTYSFEPGRDPEFRHPHSGPYDIRLGHSRLTEFFERLDATGWEVTAQARGSTWHRRLMDWGLAPIYAEKNRAGFHLNDRQGRVLFESRWPERVYPNFEEVPELIVQTLLFIENREILDPIHTHRNPAVEWDRLANAVLDLSLSKINPTHSVSGGSTLATQIEKLRHSPGGRTRSVWDKSRQMLAASLRAYQQGRETTDARRRIVCDYLNSVPLAAIPGYGEVYGLGDGLAIWFGADFDEVNRLLRTPYAHPPAEVARAYRQVLSLLLAIRRPTHYLVQDRTALASRVNTYLPLLARAGLIPSEVYLEALTATVGFRERYDAGEPEPFLSRKGVYSARVDFLQLLGLDSFYDLDRLDLTADSTIDAAVQQSATQLLDSYRDPEVADASGLVQHRLLEPGDPAGVIYSLSLYERAGDANLLRVQADNYPRPLNINQGTKLELGSTAKLRTLATYLEVVAELHKRFSPLSKGQLTALEFAPDDRLSHWVREFLLSADEPSLAYILEAALDRSYSASPRERFFTGGGLHRFSNFDSKDNSRSVTVREALRRSVNLAFIRLMRDLVAYHTYRLNGVSPRIFADQHDPVRLDYLERFVDFESRKFLSRFYREYEGLGPDEALQVLAGKVRQATAQLAAVYRYVYPGSGIDGLGAFLTDTLPQPDLSDELIEARYEDFAPGRFSLADLSYVAGVHPLELWLVGHKSRKPDASLPEVLEASAQARRDAYDWLLLPRKKAAQDRSIRVILEQDAFQRIHARWRRLGYPFDHLVPSYATAIGSSGDTPAALAELAGIILSNGVDYPTFHLRELRFAEGTPFETHWRPRHRAAEQVLHPFIADLLRRELIGVVEAEGGTGARARRSVVLPGGRLLTVGGKTGTGDNRYEVISSNGQFIASRVINRTATFVFFIDDRFFGTVTAFVPGEAAAGYRFTSSLPVQIFRNLVPTFMPLLTSQT